MNGVLGLLVGSAVVGMHGHRPLQWLADRQLDPTILLTGWLLSTVGLIVSTVASITLLALPADEHPAAGIFRLAGGCWTALSSGSLPGWREGLAAVGVIGVATILLRIGWALTVRRRRRRSTAPHVEQLRLLAAGMPSGDPLWVRDDRPLALSIGGRPGVIIMSDSLRHHLTPRALAATMEHERAHLRGRHHLLVAIVETLAAAFAMSPFLRAAPAALADLIELAADAQAARRCSAGAVQEALSRLTGQPTPAVGLAMASHLTQARLTRLTTGSIGASRAMRLMGCTAAAIAALSLPAAAGWLALEVVGCVVA
ncbi:M56 family metallopeptidase [Klenkia terrae]|jgi:Zn-dependent protease with chaperone function|uniref:M56 family metallopeptidase n=1 Tax=Klenkia terrae TaxID=1052259 RepID=A0ABU8E4U4_9ACTN|nr:M56 family metallopeptidase [Klenkia terrae]